MHERSERLKRHIHALLDAGVRRTTFFPLVAESLGRTQGQPRPIRRAQAFAHLLDHVEQVVLPEELITGSILGMWPLAAEQPAWEDRLAEARRAVDEHYRSRSPAGRRPRRAGVARWALMARDHYDASVSYADLQRLARRIAGERSADERASYVEVFYVLEHHFVFDYGQARRLMDLLPWLSSNHLHLNYGKGLRRGLGDIRREALDRQAAADEPEKREFHESVLIALDAAIRFIRRYAETLKHQAADCRAADPAGRVEPAARAAELEQMAEVCSAVAEGAPRTFREALQLTWLLHTIGNIAGGSALSLGRFDQYMFPFYQGDLDAGRITRDQAKLLIECMWLKVNEPKMRTVQSLCLGGLRPDGADGTNELTYLCLEVAAESREPYPNTAVRLHAASPDALWRRVVATLLAGTGQPMLYNDDVMIPALVRVGYPARDARDHYPMGCVETMLGGTMPTYQGSGTVVFPGQLELVFSNGEPNLAGERGPATGELSSFRTFEDFLDAYLTQVRLRVEELLRAAEDRHRKDSRLHCDPFASALIDDCLAKGLDVCRGGARYPASFTIGSMGLGTAVDALSAVKTFVYDRKMLTLQELKDALDADFAGLETLRRQLADGTPAFGNDLADVDAIAVKVHDAFADAVLGWRSSISAIHSPQMFSYTSHVFRGEITAATPNGRPARTAFSDGMGPSQGKDTRGPTCLLNSVARLDQGKLPGGCALNLKLDPGLVRGAKGAADFLALLRAYLRKGGLQVQVNLVDTQTLRAAQEQPEQYRHVIVRVAGFCEYFTNLDRRLQDEIIERTMQRQAVS